MKHVDVRGGACQTPRNLTTRNQIPRTWNAEGHGPLADGGDGGDARRRVSANSAFWVGGFCWPWRAASNPLDAHVGALRGRSGSRDNTDHWGRRSHSPSRAISSDPIRPFPRPSAFPFRDARHVEQPWSASSGTAQQNAHKGMKQRWSITGTAMSSPRVHSSPQPPAPRIPADPLHLGVVCQRCVGDTTRTPVARSASATHLWRPPRWNVLCTCGR